MKLPPGLAGRRGVVLDTMVLVYFFEAHAEFGPRCKAIIEAIDADAFEAVVSPVTLAEIVVKPVKENRASLADVYRHALVSMKGVSQASISAETGFRAGVLRAKYGMPLPDMLQVAVALQSPKPAIITNDRALKKVREVEVFLLSDFK